MDIEDQLREILTKSEITDYTVAMATGWRNGSVGSGGVTPGMITKFRRRERSLSANSLAKICMVFGVRLTIPRRKGLLWLTH